MGDGLLKWANSRTRGHDHITPTNDFDESWADGLGFCALFYAYFPEKIPIKTLKADTEADKLKNLALAFKVGEDAGIDPLLEPADTLHVHEKKSIMLYLSEIYAVLKELPIKFQASSEWNKRFDENEKARKFAEWKARKDAEAKGEVYTSPKPNKVGSVAGKWQGDAKEEEKEKETPSAVLSTPSRNSVSVRWNPKGSAEPEKEEKPAAAAVSTRPEPSSPVPASSPVSYGGGDGDEGLSYEISGRGKEGGAEGRMMIFTVTLKLDGKPVPNPQKEDLSVFMDCPGGAPRLNIMGGGGGAYHVGCTPLAGGQHWVDFIWRGHWCKEPYLLPIKNRANKIPDHPYTGAERKAAGIPVTVNKTSSPPEPTTSGSTTPASRLSRVSSRVDPSKVPTTKEPSPDHCVCSGRTCEMSEDDCGSFNITSKDNTGDILKGEFKFDVKVSGPSSVPSTVTYNGDGTYNCSFGPASVGTYSVEVLYKGKLIQKGSWEVSVTEAMASLSVQDITILFQATDKFGKPKSSGGELENFKVIATGDEDIEIGDLEDGRYTLDYNVVPGQNTIDVQFQGESLGGFPLTFYI